jgi:transcriptional regulator with XRE-family HTH domain
MVGSHHAPTDSLGNTSAEPAANSTFEDALRAAIRARGLSLERIHQRLRMAGAEVSPATLSYWQSGRTRPERARSLVALGHLEHILQVPPGTLSNRLGPPRPRGRWLNHTSGELGTHALWAEPAPVSAVLRQVNTQWDSWLTRLSQHDRFEVGPDGTERSLATRHVLRAEDDGPDRWTCVYQVDKPVSPPTLEPSGPCRLGHQYFLPEQGFFASEVLFDRPLNKGETVVCEYKLIHGVESPVARNYERKFRFPVREYVLEVRFQEPALPVHCYQYEAITAADKEDSRALSLDGANGVHAVALGFGPGRFGIRWDW